MLYGLLLVSAGALIGGGTNYLAIRMLFRPLRPWRLGRWRVPFTPGLIPKRREELAAQLGRLVEEYLFTPEGIRRILFSNSFQQELKNRLNCWLERQMDANLSLSAWLRQAVPFWTERTEAEINLLTRKWLRRRVFSVFSSRRSISDWLGTEGNRLVDPFIESGSRTLLKLLDQYLHSSDGQKELALLFQRALQGQPLLAMMGRFLDGERLVQWVMPAAEQVLRQPETAEILSKYIRRGWEEAKDRTLSEVLDSLGAKQAVQKWVMREIYQGVDVVRWLDGSLEERLRPVRELFDRRFLPQWDRLWLVLDDWLESFCRFLRISEVVEKQVLQFPLPRLEEIILDVASRELRMITWLGALIGGLVGGMQYMLLLVTG